MDERPGGEPEEERSQDQILEAARRASRFSREFLATVIALVTTAFGVVVALAWNTALSTWLAQLSKGARIGGLFAYALLVTVLAVLTIIFLGRLTGRIGADPIEFKYPVKPTTPGGSGG
jgi:predicted RND superfamily exporter protein